MNAASNRLTNLGNRLALARALRTIAAIAFGATTVACASAHVREPDDVAVEIYDRTEGRVLPTYTLRGQRYVVGRPGNEYAVRVVNSRGERVLAVMSVDGVNVITGDTASARQSGYVLPPFESVEVAGWRKNMSNTAAFYFTALPNSYAARTGRPDNVGVIGVALYRERPRVAVSPPISMQRSHEAPQANARAFADAAAAPAAPAYAPKSEMRESEKLGTGHGRVESSYATWTNFERASESPERTIAIYYDSYDNLLAMGVPVEGRSVARARPDAFPDRGRFVPDPR